MAKSLEGLFYSILHQILSAAPKLVHVVLPIYRVLAKELIGKKEPEKGSRERGSGNKGSRE